MATPAPTALDNTDESAMTALYRAAIGPVNSAYYLPLFARFEATPRPALSWNGSAALYTLNWLVFRKLWNAALIYTGVVLAVALGLFGIGRLVVQFSDATQWALAGVCVLLAVLVPGLGGNVLLFRATRQRAEAAVQATSTLAEACALLERKAPTRKGLIIHMVANGVGIVLLALAAFQFHSWTADTLPTSPNDTRQVATGRTIDSSVPATAASAARPAASAALPPPTAASAPVAASPASAPTATPTPQAAAPQAAASASQAAGPAPAASKSAPSPVPAASAAGKAAEATKKTSSSSKRPAASATTLTAKPADTQAKIIVLAPPVLLESASGVEVRPGDTTETPGPAASKTQRYVVNVGVANDANVSELYAQLTEANLPASLQSVANPRGARTRVRVGPFASVEQAEQAAETVRKLGLRAQVLAQP